jgi:ribosomal-protein-alanine N-acetyltransferase
MALSILIRPAEQKDCESLAALENECFPDPSWKSNDFLVYDCLVAEVEGTLAGFVVSRQTFAGSLDALPEREILNLAVTARFRRMGIATLLLKHERERGGDLFLEVRESNAAARILYQKFGFEKISRRNAYYQNPEESGIVMQLKW